MSAFDPSLFVVLVPHDPSLPCHGPFVNINENSHAANLRAAEALGFGPDDFEFRPLMLTVDTEEDLALETAIEPVIAQPALI